MMTWDDEREPADAPVDYGADEARGWANGWNAAVTAYMAGETARRLAHKAGADQ